MIFIPMKMNNSRINWHAMGILYYYFLADRKKYIIPFQKYNGVILEHREMVQGR